MQVLRFAIITFAFLFMVLHSSFGQLWSGVISNSRATDWTQAGIPGGIPSGSWTQCGATIAPYGSSGSPASPSTIINALNHKGTGYTSCTANQYVLLGAGDFYLNGGIRTVGVSNQELRGSGPTQTRLHFSGGSTCQGGNGTCLIGFESSDNTYSSGKPTSYNWTAGYTQGSTSITLSSSASIQVGTMVVLDQCDTGYSGASCSGSATDNGNLFNCGDPFNGLSGCSFNAPLSGTARPHRFQQEMATVASCSPSCNNSGSTTITLAEPLHHVNWASGQTPQAWFIQPAKYVGVTNLEIDGTSASYSSATTGLSFSNDDYFWARNVTFNSLPNITLWIIQSEHGDIESNYIYNSGQSSATSDNSAINWFGSNNLIANNICQNCHLAMIGNGPNSGNVIAYNYFINGYTGNDTIFGAIWDGHSNGADYNLYEGNVVNQIFQDQPHGTHLMETFYRNLFTGWESCANGNCGSNTFKAGDLVGVEDLSFNRYENYIANVVGTPGVHTLGYTYSSPMYFSYSGSGLGYPWNLGSGNSNGTSGGYAGGPIPIDPKVASTTMRWGNWDAYNSSIQWNSSEVPSGIAAYPNAIPTSKCTSSSSCPASFYYSSRPSWWNSSIPFPAIGPDVSSGNVGQCSGTLNTRGQYAGVAATSSAQCSGASLKTAWGGHVNAIPSMACYLATLNGPPDGTGGMLAFDANNCFSGGTQSGGTPGSPTGLTVTVIP